MLKAIAFDMDDTLLDINLSAFIAILMKDEATLLAQIGRKNPLAMFAVWSGALLAINNNDRAEDDRRSNWQFFRDAIEKRTGIPLDEPAIRDAFACYEEEVLPAKNDGIIAARPREGAREAVEAALDRGLRVALFTNPCFTRACVSCRMRWGKIDDLPFEIVTRMENTTRSKPSDTYYREAIHDLGLEPHEVLMVGNDPKRDFCVPDCGLQTAYVGMGKPVRATWTGSMDSFASSLDEIEERFEERQERDLLELVQDMQRTR